MHWAVLNGHAECLGVLLERGAWAAPGGRRGESHTRITSLTAETPLQMAQRLYPEGGGVFGSALRHALGIKVCKFLKQSKGAVKGFKDF